MAKKKGYTVEELIELYVKKTEELGHIPTAEEIKEDPKMPAYITFLRKFGSGEQIVKEAKIAAKYKHQERINNQFCNDCLYDPRTCGCEIEDCKERAGLYFRLMERKIKV